MVEQLKKVKRFKEVARTREEMKGTRIEEIVVEPNLLTPLEHWKMSKPLPLT